ncbi:MAG: zinc ABC transporter solute-binding protein [Lewinella sp.]|nr:zinc ABC transporter solute-binding protein [Lewinella sp.]
MYFKVYQHLAVFLLFNSSQFLVAQANQPPLVVTSASIFADMAENIGGNLIRVQSIVPIGGDPHIYEPSPEDVRLVARADLILVNGLTFEGWMNELIANSGTRAKTVVITAP